MHRHFFQIVLLAIISLPASAAASEIDGEWNCKANGDIPIGLLTISGMSYRLDETNAGGKRTGKGGSGSLSAGGSGLVPVDGPLVDFEAVGNIADGVLFWNNSAGTIMACWRV